MKKLSIKTCLLEGLLYFYNNFTPLSILVLQVFGVTLFGNLVLIWLFNIDLNAVDDASVLPSISYHLLHSLLMIAANLVLALSIYRHLILKKPFEANILNLIQQKRYGYGFCATLKMYAVVICLTLIVLSPILMILFLLNITYVVFFLTSNNVDAGLLKNLFVLLSSPTWFSLNVLFLFIPFLIIFVFVLANFIYVPLLALIDKIASIKDSWNLLKGNRLRISLLLFCIYVFVIVGALLIYLPFSFVINDSSLWSQMLNIFLNLYFGIFMTAAIGVSYQMITRVKKRQKNS